MDGKSAKKSRRETFRRGYFALAVIILMFAVLVWRLADLQLINYEEYRNKALALTDKELKTQLQSCTETLTAMIEQQETANTAFLTEMKAETVGLTTVLKETVDPIIISYEKRLSEATNNAHRVIRKSRSLTWLSAVCAVTSLASCVGVVYMLLLHFGVL